MARYDIERAWFTSPRGRSVLMYGREGTNDWNTNFSCLNEDEYGLRELRLTGTAIDIGGYLGSVTVAMLTDNPDLRVVVVEPVPENLDLIWRNVTVNSLASRVMVIEGAAGDGQPAVVRYRFQGGENELHHAFVGNMSTLSTEVEHERRTVLTYTPHMLPVADFVKIDCEGGEWSFFGAGGAERFGRIVGEWHPVSGGSQDRLRALLGATHDLMFSGPEEGPGGFTAIRRPDAGAS